MMPDSGKGAAAGRHICIVLSSLGAGGAERVVASLSGHWVSGGARVTVIAFDDPAAPIYHRFDAGVRFERLGIDAGGGAVGRIITPLRRIAAIRRILRREQPDLLVSFLTKINVLALVASIGRGIPIVVAERNNPGRQQASRVWNAALALLYPRAAAIICQTEASIACVTTSAREKVRVIPNPVSRLAVACAAPSGRRMTAVGRLTHQKGFDLLIDAFAMIASRQPEWRLDIWGGGPERTALQRQIEHHGLQQRISLRGVSDVPGGWIAEASAFVLPSRYEGFPNVLGEAMAAGLPVVAADCAFGPADLVSDGVNGLLAKSEDVDALAGAMEKVMADAALRKRIAHEAQNVTETFSSARINALWDKLVEDVLLHPGRRGAGAS